MTSTSLPARPTGQVRVTVTSSEARLLVTLPDEVPLAELLWSVAAELGVLDPHEVHHGCTLVDARGRQLDLDAGLRDQGVRDGATLAVLVGPEAASATDADRVVYDDPAEAAGVVAAGLESPWDASDSARQRRSVLALALVVPAAVLGLHRDDGPAVGLTAAGAAVLLLIVGSLLRRSRPSPDATLLLFVSSPYGVTAGLALGGVSRGLSGAVLGGGLGLAAASLGAIVAHSSVPVFVPGLVAGVMAMTAGSLALVTPVAIRDVVAVVVVAAVLCSAALSRSIGLMSPRGGRVALATSIGVTAAAAVAATLVAAGRAGLPLLTACAVVQALGARHLGPGHRESASAQPEPRTVVRSGGLSGSSGSSGLFALGGLCGLASGTVAAVVTDPVPAQGAEALGWLAIGIALVLRTHLPTSTPTLTSSPGPPRLTATLGEAAAALTLVSALAVQVGLLPSLVVGSARILG
ncbi:MAG: EsaB/YukD family protein [Lapillicoccus sp.]